MKKLYLLFLILITIVSSCDLDINKDINYPEEVNADKYFTSGVLWVSSTVGGDLQLIGSMWAQHYAQNSSSNQYTNIDSYNIPNSSSYVTRTWSALYAGAIPDLKLAIEKSAAKGDWQYWLASKIMTAYTFHVLTEAYGDVPFSEATQFESNVNPKYDDSKTINAKLIEMLDEAIAKKDAAETAAELNPMGNADVLFKGNIANWVKFAKSLKLKILMREKFSVNASAVQALLDENDFLTDNINEAKITVFENKENISNPLYENDRRKLNTTQNLRASSTLALFLQKNNDPRTTVFFEPARDPENELDYDYVGLPQGGYTLGAAYSDVTSRPVLKATDPVYFMSYAEVEFLKAEAFVNLDKFAEAQTSYDNGVKAAFDRWRGAKDANDIEFIFPEVDVNDFIGAGKVYEFNTTNTITMKESIWRQKWISFTRTQGWEAFLESNRTAFPHKGSVNSQNAEYVIGDFAPSMNSVIGGEYPRRLIYPNTSKNYNQNAPVAVPIQTKMWWHN